MPRRYTSRHNESSTYKNRVSTPQDVPNPIKKKKRNTGLDIIILAVVAIIAFLILSPYITSLTTPTQSVSSPEGKTVAVKDFPIISEVMSSNRDALAASDGEYYDWVEVYNPTPNALNLAGFALSDATDDPAKYVFPSILLQPGEFAIVFMSGGALDDVMHAGFKISSQGESLYLYDQQSNMVDSVNIDHIAPNQTYARNLAILDQWNIVQEYTPGFFNDEIGWEMFMQTRVVYDSTLKINEVMSSNFITIQDCDGEYSDWVELTNFGTEPIYLGGYALSDSALSTREWIFPEKILLPGEYVVVFLSGKDKIDTETGQLHTNFRLNSTEDMIIVSNLKGQILDQWLVSGLDDDKSMGRVFGEDNVTYFSHPTPGFDNTEDGYSEFQKTLDLKMPAGLMISEVMSGNADTLEDSVGETYDWIELYNSTTEDISLSGYTLSDDATQLDKWGFPDDFFIKPDEYLLVYASGQDTKTAGYLHTNFSLNALGEPVVLSDNEGNVVDSCVLAKMPYDVSYGRTGPDKSYQYMVYPSPEESNGTGWTGFAQDPLLELQGGIYTEGTIISINVPEGAKVYYTTNCADPTENSALYEGAFQISETTVVKARAYQENKLQSSIVTTTYFIGVDHTLPLVSLTSDPDNLFSKYKGIYSFGEKFDKDDLPFEGANFNEDWEVEGYFEMYEIDGSQAVNQGIGIRIFGAFSRAEIKKSFTLVSRSKYGASDIDYPIFPDRPFETYKSVVLRPGASEWYSSMIRDSLLTSLAKDTTSLDVQAYYPCVVYLNGEYWGVYFFREKINKYYLEQHHGIDPDNVDIIYGNGTSSRHAVTGDNVNWLKLRDYVKANDLSDPQVYKTVTDWVDVDSYMDMVINEIYVGNQDTGNIKCYREKVEDAKWAWFYYDVDWGFFYTSLTDASVNNLVKYIDEKGHGGGNYFETWLILGLLENEDFKKTFIERFAYHINKTYKTQRVIDRIDELYKILDPEMQQDRDHWNYEWSIMPSWYKKEAIRSMGYTSWSGKQKDRLIDYATQRPSVMKNQLINFFEIDDTWANVLFP